jgi:septal ring factor EnvC (AmiA/AmiB activator)
MPLWILPFFIFQNQSFAANSRIIESVAKINILIQKHLEKEADIEQQKQKLELAISNLSEEISDIEADIRDRQHELANKFRYILRATGSDFMRNLFESKNAGQLERNLKFLTLFSRHDLSLIKSYKAKAVELENKKQMETQRFSVFNDLVKKLKSEEAELKSDLNVKNALLNKIIRTERSEHLELGRQFTDAMKRGDIRSAEKYSLLIGKSFIDKRGFLNWPIKGTVIKKFGLIKDQEFRIHLPYKGIAIDSKAKSVVKSVAFGKVVRIEKSKTASYTLLINHGRKYHTLYSNLGNIKVSLGETVQDGQILGLSSKDAFHFEIRDGLLAKDPLAWLAPPEIAQLNNKNPSQKESSIIENWENVQ